MYRFSILPVEGDKTVHLSIKWTTVLLVNA